MFIPSEQQQALFSWITHGRGNARVDARAGTGKTTTLIKALDYMTGSVAFVAFNKSIADEIKLRSATSPTTARVDAATFHSLGFRAWRKLAPTVAVDDKKVGKLATGLGYDETTAQFTTKLVGFAKQHALGFLRPMDEAAAWYDLVRHHDLEDSLPEDGRYDVETLVKQSIALLRASIATDERVIDFNDQLYAPLIHNARMWQYDWVLVDEAQDTNPARRALCKKMLRPGGRLIAVGDPYQAIYGFTGADADALDLIEREFHTTRFPLTMTYRCGRVIVDWARRYVADFEAHPSNPEGDVRQLEYPLLEKQTFAATDAILCRNTAPLVATAFQLIRKGIPCYVMGRDIGAGLKALALKWKAKTLGALEKKLVEYASRETERLMAKGEEMKAASLNDKVETLLVIMEGKDTMASLFTAIDTLFDENNDAARVILSTIHKAKGREWDRVFWLGPETYQPSKYARQAWQLAQEDNLMYVAITRAKSELVVVSAPPKRKK